MDKVGLTKEKKITTGSMLPDLKTYYRAIVKQHCTGTETHEAKQRNKPNTWSQLHFGGDLRSAQ